LIHYARTSAGRSVIAPAIYRFLTCKRCRRTAYVKRGKLPTPIVIPDDDAAEAATTEHVAPN
jgi:hypothetical protein